MLFYNGLFVNSVEIRGNTLDVDFNTPAERRYQIAQIDVKIQLTMWDAYGTKVDNAEYERNADYDSTVGFQIPIELPLSTDRIGIRILFDGIEMYKSYVYIGQEIMI